MTLVRSQKILLSSFLGGVTRTVYKRLKVLPKCWASQVKAREGELVGTGTSLEAAIIMIHEAAALSWFWLARSLLKALWLVTWYHPRPHTSPPTPCPMFHQNTQMVYLPVVYPSKSNKFVFLADGISFMSLKVLQVRLLLGQSLNNWISPPPGPLWSAP